MVSAPETSSGKERESLMETRMWHCVPGASIPSQSVDSIWYTGVPAETGPFTNTFWMVSEAELLVLVKVTLLL
jgi:hypothetical protein